MVLYVVSLMAKFKFKIDDTTSIRDAEDAINYLKNCDQFEIPFSQIVKIAEFIGCEYKGGKGGTKQQFKHKELFGVDHYYNGCFQIHTTNSKVKTVYKDNFKKYLYRPFMMIIKILESKESK